MLKTLLLILLISTNNLKAETIIKGIDKKYLSKISKDGEIRYGRFNPKTSNFAFTTDTKLWFWNIETNKLQSIKFTDSDHTSPIVTNLNFLNNKWIIESHNSLYFIDRSKSKRSIIDHPELRSGKSIGISFNEGSYFWAHTDGSLKINDNDLSIRGFLKPLLKPYDFALSVKDKVIYSHKNNLFVHENKEDELIYHSPSKIRDIAKDKKFCNACIQSFNSAVVSQRASHKIN